MPIYERSDERYDQSMSILRKLLAHFRNPPPWYCRYGDARCVHEAPCDECRADKHW
ncbi:hypothetical protein [Novosphingobium sp. Leaf2]|uniref:hypothetical protein n=1 Tax=Novosphingobium sp. Leaf2 TaxID=1735670 RepID=UPI001F305B80|nr:hypothetical protein [Novosphingobium sp. Leaf2]